MKNTDFYAYCREQRKTETDPNKKQALTDAYNFMRECGVTKDGVKMFVDRMIREPKNADKVESYKWLQGVFDGPPIVDPVLYKKSDEAARQSQMLFGVVDGPSEPVVSDGQMQLF